MFLLTDELEEYNQLKELNQKDVSVKVDKVVRAKIPFKSCLDSWLCDEVISDFWSSATKVRTLLVFLFNLLVMVTIKILS